jgi:hypothetical protein
MATARWPQPRPKQHTRTAGSVGQQGGKAKAHLGRQQERPAAQVRALPCRGQGRGGRPPSHAGRGPPLGQHRRSRCMPGGPRLALCRHPACGPCGAGRRRPRRRPPRRSCCRLRGRPPAEHQHRGPAAVAVGPPQLHHHAGPCAARGRRAWGQHAGRSNGARRGERRATRHAICLVLCCAQLMAQSGSPTPMRECNLRNLRNTLGTPPGYLQKRVYLQRYL